MSEPEAQVEVSPGAPGEQGRPLRQEPPRDKKPRSRGTLIGIVGGLVISGIAGLVVVPNIVRDKPPVVGEESTLEVLLPGEINAALPTLDPGTSKTAVDDAKNCKVPLGWVTLTQRPGGQWRHGAHPFGIIYVAADQAHPRAPARRRALSRALSHGPWRSYVARRGGQGGLLSDARGHSRRQWRIFRQCEVAGSQSVPIMRKWMQATS